jgi:hypothetical protein
MQETSVKAGDKQSWFLAYSSTLMMETTYSPETQVNFQRPRK